MKKTNSQIFKLSVLSAIAISMIHPTLALADDDEAAALMNPTSTVTVEEIYVSQGSQKFGEYNGLNKLGGYLNGNVNIRGGDAYKDNANGGTQRWNVNGTDLGLSDRSANIGYSDQGSWSVGIGYDALTHNLAPGYQTPYQGSMGGNSFTLPSSIGGKNVPFTIPSAGATPTGTQSLTGAGFNNSDISTTRQNTSLNTKVDIDRNSNVTFDFNHLDQSGAKLMAFASSQWTAPLVNAGTPAKPTAAVYGQGISILPNPTNYQTDTANLAYNWKGESSHFSASYFGSFFRDGYNGVQFQTFGVTGSSGTNTTATGMDTMSTAPSNTLQQLNLSGGYDLAAKTKLTSNLSYGRNTQNTSSAVDPFQVGTFNQINSAFNGLVNTSHADVKVVDQSFQDLTLAAGYKFDGRDNLSQSNMQSFNSVGGAAAYYPNTPLSYKNSIFEASGEYKLTKDQKASLTYQNKYLNQYCNQYAVGSTGGAVGSTITGTLTNGALVGNSYPAGANCVTTPSSISNNLTALYKNKVSEDFNFRLSYGYDVRSATNSTTAIGAFTDANPNGTTTYLPGQNGQNYIGFQPYFEASRIQQVVKGGMNWDATDKLSLGLGGKYTEDNYTASTYGVQNANIWSVNFDATYKYAEKAIVTAYATQQNGMRNLLNLNGTTTGTYNNNLNENDTTLGLGVKHAGLMQDKLTLLGDLSYSLGQTSYSTALNYPTSGANACGLPTVGTCGTLPTIANRMAALKFGGSYQIDKHSMVGLRYTYQHLNSNDYYYNGYQTGYTPNSILPTNQTSGSYNVNVISASYMYSFD